MEMSPVAADALAEALGCTLKRSFEAVVAGEDEEWPEPLARFAPALSQHRITSWPVLARLSKRAWKRVGVPVGVRVEVERYMRARRPAPLDGLSTELHALRVADRMLVQDAGGQRYEADRYCPHKGHDLKGCPVVDGILVCPAHGWRFDLSKGGQCVGGKRACSLNARLMAW